MTLYRYRSLSSYWKCFALFRPVVLVVGAVILNCCFLPSLCIWAVTKRSNLLVSSIGGLLAGVVFLTYGFGPLVSRHVRRALLRPDRETEEGCLGFRALQLTGFVLFVASLIQFAASLSR